MVFLHPVGAIVRLLGAAWGLVAHLWAFFAAASYFRSSIRKVVPLPTSELRT